MTYDQMTDEQIDALVAERVMGWRWHKCHTPNLDGKTVYWFVSTERGVPDWWERPTECEKPERSEQNHIVKFGVERYSTDIAAAWEVVEKMRIAVVPSEDGWYAIVPGDILHGSVRGTDVPNMTLEGREGERFVVNDNPARAICIAALKALDGK